MEPQLGEVIQALHRDLARKYARHGAKIQEFWRSFDPAHRARCMKAGAMNGIVLQHPLDRAMGNVYKIVPDWNLRDITSSPDKLLDMLEDRTSKTLCEQFLEGVNGEPGDRDLIHEMMRTRNLRHIDPFKDCYTFFMDDSSYGKSFRILQKKEETLAGFAPAIRAGVCIPQSHGELVLHRQDTLLQSLVIIIDDILEEGSKTRKQGNAPKADNSAALAGAFSKLSTQPKQGKLSIHDLISSVQDYRSALEERLDLVSSEPIVLAHDVNHYFFTRPELVPDEKGRIPGVHTDDYISGAVLDALRNAVQASATWQYIDQLLGLLNTNPDKVYRPIIVQEISNLCHLEYTRAQQAFKRRVQTDLGMKWFKRVSNVYDKAGNVRVTIKGNPEDLTRSDPQLHYLLRLCQPETTAAKAIDWLQKLGDLHSSHPEERDRLQAREVESLANLAIITAFISDITPTISMPAASKKKSQLFVSRVHDLEAELNLLKKDLDLLDFASPIDNLLEPGMAEGALKALDDFIVDKTGTKLGFLYQDLIQDCLAELNHQYQQAKARLTKTEVPPPLPLTVPEKPEERIQHRRQKEKTRTTNTSDFEIRASDKKYTDDDSLLKTVKEEIKPAPVYKVSSATAQVFSSLFKKSLARSPVSWVSFTAAMAELGFSVVPKFGSVFTFYPPPPSSSPPPETPEAVQQQSPNPKRRPLTLHRPHHSHIEGCLSLIYARRLEKAYGWGEDTFKTA